MGPSGGGRHVFFKHLGCFNFYPIIKKTQVYQYAGISILVAIYHLVINHGSGTSTIYRFISHWNNIFLRILNCHV